MASKKGKWISVKEMSEILGVSDRTIRRRMNSGLLTHKKVGRNYLVFLSEEDTEQPEEHTQEQPKKEDTRKRETPVGDNYLLDVLVKQLEEKDKQINELNERIREAHLIANNKLLSPPREEPEETSEIYEVVKKKGKKINVGKVILYVLLVVSVGLLVFMIIQSGLVV